MNDDQAETCARMARTCWPSSRLAIDDLTSGWMDTLGQFDAAEVADAIHDLSQDPDIREIPTVGVIRARILAAVRERVGPRAKIISHTCEGAGYIEVAPRQWEPCPDCNPREYARTHGLPFPEGPMPPRCEPLVVDPRDRVAARDLPRLGRKDLE